MFILHIDSSDVLFVSFTKGLDEKTKKKLIAHHGHYYFVDGPSHGVKNERFVWLPIRVDLEDLEIYEYETNYSSG